MIITKKTYWHNLPKSTKSYWQKVAHEMGLVPICTHRPSCREFPGITLMRRASTGGKFGKSSDFKKLSLPLLLAGGFIRIN